MEYTYAALLLHKVGKEVNEKHLKSVIAATGVEADESKIKALVASLKGVDIDKELDDKITGFFKTLDFEMYASGYYFPKKDGIYVLLTNHLILV